MPDAELHAYVNDLERPITTHLYRRRMYETMAVWQTVGDEPGAGPNEANFAELWRGLDDERRFASGVVHPHHRTR